QPENRRLELKEIIKNPLGIAKTVVAFCNGAGGELYLGIKDKPRNIMGIPDGELFSTEEKINNIIFDSCYPTIIPEISFFNIEDKTVIRVKIFRGSQPPYYLKAKGKPDGTYIRVGSSNRLASEEIIAELERAKHNLSFDSMILSDINFGELNFPNFKKHFEEKTGRELNLKALEKLGLVKKQADQIYPTNSLILLSDSEQKNRLFPYAKVECARFKGIKTDTFLDQASFVNSISLQPDKVIDFIKRNIAKGSRMNGIYREDHWEYPLEAIREAVINAIVHRDYSLLGKDIKIAIFDDMLEITSPGTFPPSLDFKPLPIGQSEIRNRTIAPIFKMMGMIEQWGTGFRKITESLYEYPGIEIRYSEPGIAFQIQFCKREKNDKKQTNTPQAPHKYPTSTPQAPHKHPTSTKQVENVLKFCKTAKTRNEIQIHLKLKDRKYFSQKIFNPFLENGHIKMLYPDKPQSPKQKYITTIKGKEYLKSLENSDEKINLKEL
ncbi:MAG: putative DNA binding domain-containing protein, partial [Candidatus Cloacimonadota bacterium]|nr:putative DNA binding domain-containing protein [Candidatus Cloacimonadota bacterium]